MHARTHAHTHTHASRFPGSLLFSGSTGWPGESVKPTVLLIPCERCPCTTAGSHPDELEAEGASFDIVAVFGTGLPDMNHVTIWINGTSHF